jgi:hypothetical protein
MAVKIFQKRNNKPQGNQDYLEERWNDSRSIIYNPNWGW